MNTMTKWANKHLLCSTQAWHAHDKQLCTHFIAKPFILDPKGTVNCQGLIRAQTDAAIAMIAASHGPLAPWGNVTNEDCSPHSGHHCHPSHSPDVHHHPYDGEHRQGSFQKPCLGPTSDILCICCCHTSHKASKCKSDDSSKSDRQVIVEW